MLVFVYYKVLHNCFTEIYNNIMILDIPSYFLQNSSMLSKINLIINKCYLSVQH